MKPFDIAWQLLKTNPSWMREKTDMGNPHTDDLPNPFEPNYQQQLMDWKEKRNAENEAIERRNEIDEQKWNAYLEREQSELNNQMVGLDKVPTKQIYGAGSRLSPNQKFIENLANKKIQAQEEKERQKYENKPTSDREYQKYY